MTKKNVERDDCYISFTGLSQLQRPVPITHHVVGGGSFTPPAQYKYGIKVEAVSRAGEVIGSCSAIGQPDSL